jgi:NADPH2 dehydrogenase
MATTPALFQPIKVGSAALKHRVVLAPLTRLRGDSSHVPLDIVATYYEQRGSTPGMYYTLSTLYHWHDDYAAS